MGDVPRMAASGCERTGDEQQLVLRRTGFHTQSPKRVNVSKGISKELCIRGCSEQRENETALLWSERENAGELESGREGEQSRTKELKCLQKAGRWKKMANKQECREGLHHPLRERAGLIT